ncbi:hypothetical protein CAI21_22110 [Alkalilimnicola ehrlichii]|uniref:Uncharacterized protein n=1 Tax=Alkalilimnicola ehrlichii TaxID=351052 RepID=A0A3E0WSF5_9GAMM|nr:hypothetical protein [Alkalilimnicola ehrlichii]RFA24322.1 hypothetical protein CAI21_22110 [Alkalilimnicola ehrlichii]RFA35123.1 hypothetical protein CAL65_13530 [Alkalilimnicola ehrlichii]
MRRVKGPLPGPGESSIESATLTLRALVSTPDGVPEGATLSMPVINGEYDAQVRPGIYSVTLVYPDGRSKVLYRRLAVADGDPASLFEIAEAAKVPPSLVDTLMSQMADMQSRIDALESGQPSEPDEPDPADPGGSTVWDAGATTWDNGNTVWI